MPRLRQHRSPAVSPPDPPTQLVQKGSAAESENPRALSYIFDVTRAEVDLQFKAAERYESKARNSFAVTAALFAAVQAVALRQDVLNALSDHDKSKLLHWATAAAIAVFVSLVATLLAGRPSKDSVVSPQSLLDRLNALRTETDQMASQQMVGTYIKLLDQRRTANRRRLMWTYGVQVVCGVAVSLLLVELLVALGTLS